MNLQGFMRYEEELDEEALPAWTDVDEEDEGEVGEKDEWVSIAPR